MHNFLEFFGFKEDPFKITPDARYFFLSESHREALMSLEYLLISEEGFAVIIGEPGTGKTLTVKKFIEDNKENIKYAYILFPNLSPTELFEAILEDFGIRDFTGNKNKLFTKLKDVLIEGRKRGKKVLIIIDEAQNLPIETLEELRILSNLETEDLKLLQIILLGQPELEEMLNSKELRQLKQRITIFSKLRNLNSEEVKSYIELRISKAGGNVKLSKKAYQLVYKLSLGIPRLINVIMERALMAAFVDASNEIKPKHIRQGAESIGIFLKEEKKHSKLIKQGIYSVFIILLGIVLFLSGKGILEDGFIQTDKPAASHIQEDSVRTPITEAVVIVPMLNMRENPDRKSSVVYLLREGNRLEVLGRSENGWARVVFRDGNREIKGWVREKYIRLLKDS